MPPTIEACVKLRAEQKLNSDKAHEATQSWTLTHASACGALLVGYEQGQVLEVRLIHAFAAQLIHAKNCSEVLRIVAQAPTLQQLVRTQQACMSLA